MPGGKKQTGFPGVRYREHPARKHGAMKDRYYFIRYQYMLEDGTFVRREEGLGWASKGWSPSKANEELARLKKAQRTGEGPRTLAESRKLADQKKQAEEEREKEEAKKKIEFGEYFKNTYYPVAKTSKKKVSYEKEDCLYRHWIEPEIGKKPFTKIAQTDIERIKKKLLDKKRSPTTIQYVFAVIRQVWNMARTEGITSSESPTKAVRKPKKDSKRLRFLSKEEAEKLLSHLKEDVSMQLHDMALLSLHTGMRAGEIFFLTWGDIDMAKGLILIRDPKPAKNRVAYMTKEVSNIFRKLKAGENTEFVFKDKRHGGKIKEISNAFHKAVNDLNLNEGIEDPRLMVVFHTLRHTFASWLVENGENLYTVKELMGHSTLAMTERYSHLGQNTLQDAVKRLDKKLSKKNDTDKSKAQKEGAKKRAFTVMK